MPSPADDEEGRRQFECQTAHSRKAQLVKPTTLRSHAHLRWVLHRACGSSQIRGRRESRAPDAPAASHAEKLKHTSNRHHRYAERSGLPCAMVLRLIFALSLVTGLSCHHPRQNALSILAALTPASGCQDHTTSPSAGWRVRLSRQQRPSHPASTFVTIRETPLDVSRDTNQSIAVSTPASS